MKNKIVYVITQRGNTLAVCSSVTISYEKTKSYLPDDYKLNYDWFESMLRNQGFVVVNYFDEYKIDLSVEVEMFELDKEVL